MWPSQLGQKYTYSIKESCVNQIFFIASPLNIFWVIMIDSWWLSLIGLVGSLQCERLLTFILKGLFHTSINTRHIHRNPLTSVWQGYYRNKWIKSEKMYKFHCWTQDVSHFMSPFSVFVHLRLHVMSVWMLKIGPWLFSRLFLMPPGDWIRLTLVSSISSTPRKINQNQSALWCQVIILSVAPPAGWYPLFCGCIHVHVPLRMNCYHYGDIIRSTL